MVETIQKLQHSTDKSETCIIHSTKQLHHNVFIRRWSSLESIRNYFNHWWCLYQCIFSNVFMFLHNYMWFKLCTFIKIYYSLCTQIFFLHSIKKSISLNNKISSIISMCVNAGGDKHRQYSEKCIEICDILPLVSIVLKLVT